MIGFKKKTVLPFVGPPSLDARKKKKYPPAVTITLAYKMMTIFSEKPATTGFCMNNITISNAIDPDKKVIADF